MRGITLGGWGLFGALMVFMTSVASLDPNNPLHDTAHYKRHEEADFVVPCVLQLLERYFKSQRVIKGSLSIVGMTKDPTLIERSTLRILNEGKRHAIAMMVKDPSKWHTGEIHVTDKAANYFILLSGSADLNSTMVLLSRLPTWNPNANVVVLFTKIFNETLLQSETIKVLNGLFEYSMYNVNVMSQRVGTYVIQAYTYFPYEGDNCAVTVKNIKMINECFNEKEDQTDDENVRITKYHEEQFPKYPHRLHGCHLNVSVSVMAPYVVREHGEVEKGLEVLMLKQIAEEMDLSLVYRIIDQEVVNSVITPNKSGGIYSNVLQGNSDIIVGGFHENTISRQVLGSSVPYYQDDLTWCVAPAGLASNLTNVFGIFNLLTWFVTIAGIVATGLCILAYSRMEERQNHENITWSVIIALSFTLSQSSHFYPNRTTVKIFLLIVMFYGLHFNVAYHSFLITVLTRPRFEPQIATSDMAVLNGFTFLGNEDTYEYYVKKGNDSITKAILRNFKVCKNLDSCLARLKQDNSIAVAVSRRQAENNPIISETEMYCFKRVDNIYTYSVSMLTKKDYHLLPKVNDIIRTISESGLLMKWEKDSEKKVAKTSQHLGGHGGDAIKLKMEHVQGGFLVWMAGLVLALVFFILEWIFHFLVKWFHFNKAFRSIDELFC